MILLTTKANVPDNILPQKGNKPWISNSKSFQSLKSRSIICTNNTTLKLKFMKDCTRASWSIWACSDLTKWAITKDEKTSIRTKIFCKFLPIAVGLHWVFCWNSSLVNVCSDVHKGHERVQLSISHCLVRKNTDPLLSWIGSSMGDLVGDNNQL